tara:strand:- start:250 stop:462 length:213 start_codon:yes stop_codon:yes gene_type:complete
MLEKFKEESRARYDNKDNAQKTHIKLVQNNMIDDLKARIKKLKITELVAEKETKIASLEKIMGRKVRIYV